MYFVTISFLYIFLASPIFFYKIFNQASGRDKNTASCTKFQQALINRLMSSLITITRMKEKALAHQYISIHNTKEHISTNNNVICIYYIAYMYIGVMIVLEQIQNRWDYISCGSECPIQRSFRLSFYNFIKYRI